MHGQSEGTGRRWVRAGLVALALIAAILGGWQFFAPQAFYDAFPGLGHPWVSLLPAYNEHLLRDVGGFNLAFAALFVWAARTLRRDLVRASLTAWLVSATLHLAYHTAHLEPFAPEDAAAQMLALGIVVVLPAALLAATGRWSREEPSA